MRWFVMLPQHLTLERLCGSWQGESAARISTWVDEQAGDAARLPAFVEALATQILEAAVPEPEVRLGRLWWPAY